MGRSFVYALLCAACAVIVLLVVQNDRLREMNDALVRKSAAPSSNSWLPRLSIKDMDGAVREIGQPAGRLQLLYFFNPDCPACAASLPALISLQRAAHESGPDVELIGISRPPAARVRDYATIHGLKFPTLIPDPKSKSLLGVRVVPTLLVVSAGGKIELSHIGVLDDSAVKKILATLPPDRRVDGATIPGKENFQ